MELCEDSGTVTRPPDECVIEINFSYYSTKTDVVGTQKNGPNEQKNGSFEHQKHICFNLGPGG